MRRKVLGDELASEERLLARRAAPMATARRRRCRTSRTTPRNIGSGSRSCVRPSQLHERNVEALRKEIAALR